MWIRKRSCSCWRGKKPASGFDKSHLLSPKTEWLNGDLWQLVSTHCPVSVPSLITLISRIHLWREPKNGCADKVERWRQDTRTHKDINSIDVYLLGTMHLNHLWLISTVITSQVFWGPTIWMFTCIRQGWLAPMVIDKYTDIRLTRQLLHDLMGSVRSKHWLWPVNIRHDSFNMTQFSKPISSIIDRRFRIDRYFTETTATTVTETANNIETTTCDHY